MTTAALDDRPPAASALRAFAATAVVLVALGVAWVGGSSYRAIQQNPPGLATSLTSGLLQTLAQLAAVVCLGWWTWALLLLPRRGPGRLVVRSGAQLQPAVTAAIVWALAAGALIVVDGADQLGFPLARLGQPGALGYAVTSSYLPMAWIFVALAAAALAAVGLFATRTSALLPAYLLGLSAFLLPKVVTQLTVGPDHDLGTDAAIIGDSAFALLLGIAVTLAWAPRPQRDADLLRRRVLRSTTVLAGLVLAADVLIAWFELAGTPFWENRTGWLFVAKAVLVVLVTWTVRRVATPDPDVRLARLGLGALVGLTVGVVVLRERIPPPQYFVPTSIQQNFLGFSVSRPPDLATYAFAWRPNLVFAFLAVVAVGSYLRGVAVLRRRGDHWPVGRTAAWLIGWTVVVVATSSGVGRYASASFSVHMVLHMTLNMLAPLILVLAGPLTLALRALPARRRDEPAGPREWLTSVMDSLLVRLHLHPLVIFVLFVGSYYVFYFTPLFEQSLRQHWGHQVAYLHFLVVGYAYYDTVIGVDRPPREVPHLARLGLVLAAMPFHAFFGVALMSRTDVIAEQFYLYLDPPWMTDLLGDQYVGGGIAWAAGELPLLIVVIALGVQWSRQDARAARRSDRQADRDGGQELDAYNEMLDQIRSRTATGSRR